VGGALAARTRIEIASWRDSRSLWEHVLATGEPSAVAHNNLGAMDGDAGAYDSAIAHLRESVRIRPDLGRAWLNLGVDLAKTGRVPEALEALLRARETLRPRTDALVELGNLYLNRLDRPEDAAAAFREAVAEVESLDPSRFSPLPYLGLGVALLRTGDTEEARRLLEFAERFPETRDRARLALRK
jgi:tetratricopeptide (TPR) repeat protein